MTADVEQKQETVTFEDATAAVETIDGEITAAESALADARARREQVAIDGGDTAAVRGEIRDGEEGLVDLQARRRHLLGILDRATRRHRVRTANAMLADLYSRDLESLRALIEVRRLEEAAEVARVRHRQVSMVHVERNTAVSRIAKTLRGERPANGPLPNDPTASATLQADPRIPYDGIRLEGRPIGQPWSEFIAPEIARVEELRAKAEAASKQ